MVVLKPSRAHLIEGNRMMRFEDVYEGWQTRRLSQSEAAEILDVCERSFRRYIARYEDGEGDLNSLADKRLSQASKRRAADNEVAALIELYQRSLSGWAFRTHQDRLVKELAKLGITTMAQANVYLDQTYMAQHKAEFAREPACLDSAHVPYLAQAALADILCEQHERVVGLDHTVRFEGLTLQIPDQEILYSYSRTHVRVHRYVDGTLLVWLGPRLLARFDQDGSFLCASLCPLALAA